MLQKRPVLSSFLLISALFLTLFGIVGLKPYFMSDDDAFSVLVTKGFGIALTPHENIYWMNILYGLGLKQLYAWLPQFPWHGMLLLSGSLLGFAAFLMALLRKNGQLGQLILFFLCFLIIDIHFCLFLEFTLSSFIAFQGGFFLLYVLLEEEDPRIGPLLWIGCCFGVSYLLRTEVLGLGFIISAPLWLPLVLKKGKGLLKPRFLGLIVLALVAILAAWSFNKTYYEKHTDWAEYNTYNHTFGALISLDPEYSESKKSVYDSIHWTRNDLDLFLNWYNLDPKIYSLENLKVLYRSYQGFDLGKQNGTWPLGQILSNRTLWLVYLFVLLGFIFVEPSKRATILMLAVLTVLLHVGLFFFQKSPPWVFEPLFAFVPHAMVFFSRKGLFTRKTEGDRALLYSRIALGLLVLLTLKTSFIYYQANQWKQQEEKNLSQALTQLHNGQDHLYVAFVNTIPYCSINAFSDDSVFKDLHLFAFHEYERTPLGTEMLEKYGIKDIFPAMTDRNDVLTICNPSEGVHYIRGMEEHYHRQVRPRKAFQAGFFNVYRFAEVGSKKAIAR